MKVRTSRPEVYIDDDSLYKEHLEEMSGELLSQDIAEAKMEGFQSYKKVDDVEQLWMYRTKDDETGARLDA